MKKHTFFTHEKERKAKKTITFNKNFKRLLPTYLERTSAVI